jgi:tRNA A37 threonylcarbamoyladenosine modification protein TsaB
MHQGPSILSLLDARKGRVYGGFFDCSSEIPRPLSEEQDVELGSLLCEKGIQATGEGAHVRRAEIEASGGSVLENPCASPAADLARLGLLQEHLCSPAELELRYIRLPDAQVPAWKEI